MARSALRVLSISAGVRHTRVTLCEPVILSLVQTSLSGSGMLAWPGVLATLGTSGASIYSMAPSAAVGSLLITAVSTFATGTGDSGPGVAHAAMPKNIAATTYRRFMVPPAVSSINSQMLDRRGVVIVIVQYTIVTPS